MKKDNDKKDWYKYDWLNLLLEEITEKIQDKELDTVNKIQNAVVDFISKSTKGNPLISRKNICILIQDDFNIQIVPDENDSLTVKQINDLEFNTHKILFNFVKEEVDFVDLLVANILES